MNVILSESNVQQTAKMTNCGLLAVRSEVTPVPPVVVLDMFLDKDSERNYVQESICLGKRKYIIRSNDVGDGWIEILVKVNGLDSDRGKDRFDFRFQIVCVFQCLRAFALL